MKEHKIEKYEVNKKEIIVVNELEILDAENCYQYRDCEKPEDTFEVYLPLQINEELIKWRLHEVIGKYGEANEDNEGSFSCDVATIIEQVEIYEQLLNKKSNEKHHPKIVKLVQEIIGILEDIPDGCADMFPFYEIDTLKEEYLI